MYSGIWILEGGVVVDGGIIRRRIVGWCCISRHSRLGVGIKMNFPLSMVFDAKVSLIDGF